MRKINYNARTGFYVGKPNGTLTLPLFGKKITLTGGPYAIKPEDMHGIKMAIEIDLPCRYDVPTHDFDVPEERVLQRALVDSLTDAWAHDDFNLYVGCMAGRGRTGLFLATAAHVVGIDKPVQFVRANYYRHAVETAKQEAYVTAFDRDEFRQRAMRVLILMRAINVTDFLRMTMRDKLLYVRTRFFHEALAKELK